MAKIQKPLDNQEVVRQKSYFETRMNELGITPKENRISVYSSDDSTTPKIKEIFSKDSADNIRILFPDLDGGVYTYTADTKDNPEKTFYRTRLKIPKGDMKYSQQKGSGINPFFPPRLIEKFSKKEEIEILVIVEGEFKAFKGSSHGLDIIGICGKDLIVAEKGSKELHPDIIRVIDQCKVRTIVLLLDSDTRTTKWEQDKELTERPWSFLNTVQKFSSACDDVRNQKGSTLKRIQFSHIKTDYLKKAKGLDDLLILESKRTSQVTRDLLKLDKANTYFDGLNVGNVNENKLKKYFGLDSFKSFHGLYEQFFGQKDIVFYGAKYFIQNGQYIVVERDNPNKMNIVLTRQMELECEVDNQKRKELLDNWRNDSLKYGVISTKSGYMSADIDQSKTHISFTQISNFTLVIKYHIKTSKSNKRVIELVNDSGHKVSIDIETKQLSSFALFKEITEGQGNFRFFGRNTELDNLKAKWFAEEKSCVQLETLGYQNDNFYAFSNGVYNHTFHPLDNDGVVSLNNKNYFIPYHNPKDENQFINERRFFYKESDSTFTEWSEAYIKVFGKEGSVVLLFGISCIFLDIISKSMGCFPLLFLYGEGGTGKSKLATFIQNLFGTPQPPLKLSERANTDKGRIRKMAQFVNAVVFMEEYINSLDDATIKTLTGIYDRIGYERSDMTTIYGTESIPINSGVIMSGNEYPTNDPLVQRLIVLDFYKNEFSDQEREDFQKLKQINDKGITVILGEILGYRDNIKESFDNVFSEESRLLSKAVREKGISPSERMVQSYSMILTIHKIISPLLSIPIKYDELSDFLVEKIRVQSERRSVQGDVQMFWDTFLSMARKGTIYNEIDYRILEGNMLAIKFKYVCQNYLSSFSNTHRKAGLSSTTLRQKLQQWDGFLGSKDVRFNKTDNTTGMVFQYDKCNIDLDHAIKHINP